MVFAVNALKMFSTILYACCMVWDQRGFHVYTFHLTFITNFPRKCGDDGVDAIKALEVDGDQVFIICYFSMSSDGLFII